MTKSTKECLLDTVRTEDVFKDGKKFNRLTCGGILSR